MSAAIITQYMSITLPSVGSQDNYPEMLDNAFNIIDNHDHYNIGNSLSEKSFYWDVFDLLNHPLLSVSYLSFATSFRKSITLLPNPILSLYFLNNDLYFKDGSGVQIQITRGGAVNGTNVVDGFYGDFQQSNCSSNFSSDTSTYSFYFSDVLGSIKCDLFRPYSGLTCKEISANVLTRLDIFSSGFFYDQGSILCLEGSPAGVIKYQTTDIAAPLNISKNPRLLNSVGRFNNVNPFSNTFSRPTRYHLEIPNNIEQAVSVKSTISGVVDLVVTTGIVNPVTLRKNVWQFHLPPVETDTSLNTSNPIFRLGGFCSITPIFDSELMGVVEVFARIDYGAIDLRGEPNSIFSPVICINPINFPNPPINKPKIAFFQEFYTLTKNTVGPSNVYYFGAYYKIQVLDEDTGNRTDKFQLLVRI